jgi:hypothetical protein
LRGTTARLASNEKRAGAGEDIDRARKLAEEARALLEVQETQLTAAHAEAINFKGLVVPSVKAVLDVLESTQARPATEAELSKRAHIRGVQDASRCVPESPSAYCSQALPSSDTAACSSNYAKGYLEGERIKERDFREAVEIGRHARQSDNPFIGVHHPKPAGSCEGQWMDAYYRGYGGVDEAVWKTFQQHMIESRKQLDLQKTRLLSEIDRLQVPTPHDYIHVHEGVILGTFNSQSDSAGFMSVKSPWTQQTYGAMAMNRPGQGGGALVASFGLARASDSGPNKVIEASRAGLDHLLGGDVSLALPQNAPMIESLRGRQFDRLIVHSNGATVAEALIRRDLIKVRELNILVAIARCSTALHCSNWWTRAGPVA